MRRWLSNSPWLPNCCIFRVSSFCVQEELDIIESKISETRDSIQHAQHRIRTCREQKATVSERLGQADQALVTTMQQATHHIPDATSRMFNHASPDNTMVRVHTTCQNDQNCGPVKRGQKRSIESFRAHCPLFVENCLASMSSCSLNGNSSFLDVLDSQKACLAGQVGVPSSDICWFMHTLYTAPTGVPLSVNTSLTKVRCTISLLLDFLMTQLESALIDKELDCLSGHISTGAASISCMLSCLCVRDFRVLDM